MTEQTPQTPLSVHEPDGPPKGGIVLIQEAFGVNDHIEDVARRSAAEGWLTVAPHLFHRSGDPKLGYDDFSVVMPHMQALTTEDVLADIDAALDYLVQHGVGPEHTGVVGFCMGGTVALVTAARRDVGAAVTFYGGGVTEDRFGFGPLIEVATGLHAPCLGLYGDLDEGFPVEGVERLREAAARSGQPTDIVRYPEAGHGFHCDQRASYEAKSAEDAWARALAWFNEHLT